MIVFWSVVFVLALAFLAAVIVWAFRTRDRDDAPLSLHDTARVAWVEGLHRKPQPRGTIRPAVTWRRAALVATITALGVITHSDEARWPHLRRVWEHDTGSFPAFIDEGA